MTAIKKAVTQVGGQTALAQKLNIKQQLVWSWVHIQKKAPAKYIRTISLLTREFVSIHELLFDHEVTQNSKRSKNS